MNDFDYDCMQKKRIARSSHNHVNARRGKCRLPHENLTKKELNALNGEVRTYSLSHPMSYTTFLDIPDDMKKLYIQKLQTRFRVSDSMLGEMWGVSKQCVAVHRKALGIKSLTTGRRKQSTPMEIAAWRAFLADEPAEPERKDLFIDDEEPVINTVDNAPEETDCHVADAPRNDSGETPVPVLERIITPTPVIAQQLQLQITWANVHSWEELYELASKFPFPDKPGIVTLEIH